MFSCQDCTEEFQSVSLLRRHRAVVHRNEQECPKCDRRFLRLEGLEKHKKKCSHRRKSTRKSGGVASKSMGNESDLNPETESMAVVPLEDELAHEPPPKVRRVSQNEVSTAPADGIVRQEFPTLQVSIMDRVKKIIESSVVTHYRSGEIVRVVKIKREYILE